MPKQQVMAQLSRPYQAALILIAVLALAWFTVLRAHVSTSTGGSSSPPASTSTSAKIGSTQSNQGKSTPIYHGAAPGLQGLSRDINRAHETLGASETEAHKIEGGSSSGAQVTKSAQPAAPAAAAPSTHAPTTTVQHSSASPAPHSSHGATASRAGTVGAQLKRGKTVLLLFWKPSSAADQAVHSQVQAASRSLKGKVAVDYAKAGEVGSFGTVTRDISVLQTPTLLVIDRKGLATTITGLTDAFSIEQAVREAGG
jgi:hypothetical protein